MFSMVLVGSGSVAFDTDPNSGSIHFLIQIPIQGNNRDSTDPDPDPDPQHSGSSRLIRIWDRFESATLLLSLVNVK